MSLEAFLKKHPARDRPSRKDKPRRAESPQALELRGWVEKAAVSASQAGALWLD